MVQLLKQISGWKTAPWKTAPWKTCAQALCLAFSMLVLSVATVAPAYATGTYDMPARIDDSVWVIDEGDILSRLTESNLSQSLSSLAKKTGTEVRVVTLHRLDYGETADSFADQLFAQWFPTAEAQSNQALLVLDNVTNTAAIRSGEEVKTLLTQDIADSVAQETLMAPIRVDNKYNQAFADAGDRLVAVLSGQPDPGPPVIENNVQTEGTFATAEKTEEIKGISTVWVIGLLLAATVIPMATYYLYLAIQG